MEQALPGSDVIVHVEPDLAESDMYERVLGAALSVGAVREVHNVTVIDLGDGLDASLHLKLRGDLSLADAHGVASRVEAAIRVAAPEIQSVQTHLEPIIELGTTGGAAPAALQSQEQTIWRMLSAEVPPPRELRFIHTSEGLVVYVTLALDAATLAEAHTHASQLEELDPRHRRGDPRRRHPHRAVTTRASKVSRRRGRR